MSDPCKFPGLLGVGALSGDRDLSAPYFGAPIGPDSCFVTPKWLMARRRIPLDGVRRRPISVRIWQEYDESAILRLRAASLRAQSHRTARLLVRNSQLHIFAKTKFLAANQFWPYFLTKQAAADGNFPKCGPKIRFKKTFPGPRYKKHPIKKRESFER